MTPLLRLTALAATLALAAAARSCETHLAADLSARNRFIASADDEACIYEMGEAAAVVGKVCIDTPSGATPTHAVLNDRTAFLFLERDDGSSSQVVAYNEQEDGRYAEGAVAWAEAHSEASMARAESLLVVIGDQAGDCVVRAIPYNSTDGETGTATDIILAENSTCAVGGATAVTVDVDGTTILALDGAGGNESAALVLSRVDELDWELGGYYYYEEDEAGVLHAAVLSPGLFALAEEDALSILAPGNQTQQQQPEGLRVEATVGLEDAPTFLAAADDGTLVLCGRDNCSRYELAAGALTASSAFAPAGGLGCSAAYKRQGSFFVALTAAGDEIAFEDAAGARATIPAPSATAAPTTAEAAIKPRRDAGPSAIVWTLGCAFAAACIALALVIVWRRRRRYQQHQKVSTAAEFSAQRAY